MWWTIEIFDDKYKVRQTYDIGDFGMDIYGYEIYDENETFLRYFAGAKNLKHLKNYMKAIFYKIYE